MKSVQIERRRRRARDETFRIEKLGADPIYSRFRVGSASGHSYEVQIRDLSAPGANGCSCPDYLVNQLATCKHVEAVLLHLEQRESAAFRRATLQPPPRAFIYLRYGEKVGLEIRRPRRAQALLAVVIDAHFDFGGRFRGDPVVHFAELESDLAGLPAAARREIQVANEVRPWLDYERSRREVARERRRFVAAVERRRERFDPLREPLYPFQVRGALHLAFGRHAVLADAMGLGKTVQALAAAMHLRRREGFERALIVCPASLKAHWEVQIERFTGENATSLSSDALASGGGLGFFHIISYERCPAEIEQLRAFRPDLVILDEAQRIKNWRAATAKAVKEIPRRAAFVLTGTPIEADLDGLYSILQFLDQRLIGPLWRFNERYMRFDGRGRVVGQRNLDELKNRLGNAWLRRTRDEARSELPALVTSTIPVALPAPNLASYELARTEILTLLSRPEPGPNWQKAIQASLATLAEAACGIDEQAAPKLVEMASVLEESVLPARERALVFASSSPLLQAAASLLDERDIDHVRLDASTPPLARSALVERFVAGDATRVLLCDDESVRGLDLHAAAFVVNLDQPWSAARRNQRIARAFRLGRSDNVQVVDILAAGTHEAALKDVEGLDRALLQRLESLTPGAAIFGLEFHGRSLAQALGEFLDSCISGQKVTSPKAAVPRPRMSPPSDAEFRNEASETRSQSTKRAALSSNTPTAAKATAAAAPSSPESNADSAGSLATARQHLAVARALLVADFPAEAAERIGRGAVALFSQDEHHSPGERMATLRRAAITGTVSSSERGPLAWLLCLAIEADPAPTKAEAETAIAELAELITRRG